MQILPTVIISFVAVLIGLGILILGIYRIRSDEIDPRLHTFIIDEQVGMPKLTGRNSVQTRELTGSMSSRLILPFLKRIGKFFSRFTPKNAVEDIRHRLYIAGNPMGMGPIEFYGVRLAFILIGSVAFFFILRSDLSRTNILVGILVLIVCFFFPMFWLGLMVKNKQKEIQKDLPGALDMLSVCVDAGLGFDQALQRVGEQWQTRLATELSRVVTEMEMGLSRRDALRNLANRLNIPDLSSFVAIIIQSEQLGSSIADTLHVQADQMRVERRFRAQEKARTVPIKMLIPLAFLIFPAIMAVLIGPAIPPLLDLFK
jgi:tight adherence protein C